MKNALSIIAIVCAAIYPFLHHGFREKSPPPRPLVLVVTLAGAIELFDLLSIINPADIFFWRKYALVAEACVAPAALWFSLTYARKAVPQSISLPYRLLLCFYVLFAGSSFLLPSSAFFYSPDFAFEHILFLERYGLAFYFVLLGCLVNVLFNLEMTLLSTNLTSRWKIKFELLGAAALFAVMLFYYSQGLLFRVINMNLLPVRGVILIVAVMMMAYSRLKRGSGVRVYVSRQMAYRSVVLAAVGVYVLALGLTGEAIRHFGNSFQQALTIAAAFIVGLGLAALLLSETVKRRVRVFINNNFYRNKYDYRNQWLQFTDRLCSSATGEDLLRSIVIGFSDTFGMGSGSLFLLDNVREEYRQVADLAMRTSLTFLPGDPTVERLLARQSMLKVEADDDQIAMDEQRQFFRAYGGCFIVPLFINGAMDGLILLGRPLNKDEVYGHEDFDLMKTLAKQASAALLNLRLADQLASTRELATLGKVSAFVMHDLKNLFSSISLVLQNAQEYIAEPEFQQEMLTTLASSVARMQSLISRLKHLPETATLQRDPVDLLQLVQETAALVPGGALRITGTPTIAKGDREELQKVALNLMLNAVEATERGQQVTVEVGEQDAPYLRVKDEGCGIADEFFSNQLFTPFRTTKSKGLGIGLYQCKQIVEAHGGKIEVTSKLEMGSEFTVWLPRIHPHSL